MKARQCDREDEVLGALRGGAWSDELRAHASACPACAETSLVAGALAADARAVEHERPLPDPARIWVEARLRARRLQAARAARPVVLMRRIALACAGAAAIVVGSWLRPDLGRWLGWLKPPDPDVVSRLAFLNGVVLLVACGGLLVVAAYTFLSTGRDS